MLAPRDIFLDFPASHWTEAPATWEGGPGSPRDVPVLPLQYRVEPAQLLTRRLQVSVWHLGSLARRVFLGEVIIPLATWDFEDSTTCSFRCHPLRAKVMSGLGLGDPIPTVRAFQRDPIRETLPGALGTRGSCVHMPGF